MENSEIMGMVALIVSVAGTIIGFINHKRIRSHCCGKEVVASVDIESTEVAPASTAAPAYEVSAVRRVAEETIKSSPASCGNVTHHPQDLHIDSV